MTTLGNKYFYIILLVIVIFVIAVTIANIAYFYTAQSNKSKNLSKSQSQQLIIINSVVTVLLFISLLGIGYMLLSSSNIDKDKDKIKMIHETKMKTVNDEFDELIKLNDEQQKRIMTKESMVELAQEVKKPQIKLELENKRLKNELLKMNTRLQQLTNIVTSFKENNNSLEQAKMLLETEISDKNKIIDDQDQELSVLRDVEIQKHNLNSVFNDDNSSVSSVSSNSTSFLSSNSTSFLSSNSTNSTNESKESKENESKESKEKDELSEITSITSFSSVPSISSTNSTHSTPSTPSISSIHSTPSTHSLTSGSKTRSISYTDDDLESLDSRSKSGELSNRHKELHVTHDVNDLNHLKEKEQRQENSSVKLELEDTNILSIHKNHKSKKLDIKSRETDVSDVNREEPSYDYGIREVKIPRQKQDTYIPYEYRQTTPTISDTESELIKTPALERKSYTKGSKSQRHDVEFKEYKPFVASFI